MVKKAKNKLTILMTLVIYIGTFHNCLIKDNWVNAEEMYEDYYGNQYEGYTEGDYKYTVVEGGAIIKEYTGAAEKVQVPETLGGYPVTGLGQMSFGKKDTIKELVLNEGLKWLASESIAFCNNLENLYLPSTLQMGGSGNVKGTGGCIVNCPVLKNIELAEGNTSITVIDDVIYSYDKKILLLYPSGKADEKYVILDGVEEIADESFHGNLNLEEIVMPDSVTYIGYWAFFGVGNLKKINISENCELIGQFALEETALETFHIPKSLTYIMPCALPRGLREITVAPDNPVYALINGAVYQYNMLFWYPSQLPKREFYVKEGTKTIGSHAFAFVYWLKMIVLPEGVEYISSDTFVNCRSLEALIIPNSVNYISESAFMNCSPTIYGNQGSYAESYAKSHDMTFVSLEEYDPRKENEEKEEESDEVVWNVVEYAMFQGRNNPQNAEYLLDPPKLDERNIYVTLDGKYLLTAQFTKIPGMIIGEGVKYIEYGVCNAITINQKPEQLPDKIVFHKAAQSAVDSGIRKKQFYMVEGDSLWKNLTWFYGINESSYYLGVVDTTIATDMSITVTDEFPAISEKVMAAELASYSDGEFKVPATPSPEEPVPSDNPIPDQAIIPSETPMSSETPEVSKEPTLGNESEEKPEQSSIPIPLVSEMPNVVVTEKPNQSMNLDVDGKEGITLSDAQLILKYALKIILVEPKYTLQDAQRCLRIALKIERL